MGLVVFCGIGPKTKGIFSVYWLKKHLFEYPAPYQMCTGRRKVSVPASLLPVLLSSAHFVIPSWSKIWWEISTESGGGLDFFLRSIFIAFVLVWKKIQPILVTKVCLILVKKVGIKMFLRLPSPCLFKLNIEINTEAAELQLANLPGSDFLLLSLHSGVDCCLLLARPSLWPG